MSRFSEPAPPPRRFNPLVLELSDEERSWLLYALGLAASRMSWPPHPTVARLTNRISGVDMIPVGTADRKES